MAQTRDWRLTEAEARLVSDNSGLVYKFARRFGRFAEEDDAVQEGFIALMRAAKKFDPSRGYRFSTYAVRSIINALAKLNQKPRPPVLDVQERDLADSREARAGDGELEELRRAMGELNARDQVVLRGRYFEDQTLEEVGAAVGVTRERVRQLQRRALDELREKLCPVE
jgi:RNA polymerase primary sigma factor